MALHVANTATTEFRKAMRKLRRMLNPEPGWAIYCAPINGREYFPVLSPGERAGAEALDWDMVCTSDVVLAEDIIRAEPHVCGLQGFDTMKGDRCWACERSAGGEA